MRRGWLRQALVALAIGCAGAVAFSEAVFGTPEIARKEQLGCLVCHTALGAATLNARGEYYRAKRTLEGYVDPETPPRPDAPSEPAQPAEPEPTPGTEGQSRD